MYVGKKTVLVAYSCFSEQITDLPLGISELVDSKGKPLPSNVIRTAGK